MSAKRVSAENRRIEPAGYGIVIRDIFKRSSDKRCNMNIFLTLRGASGDVQAYDPKHPRTKAWSQPGDCTTVELIRASPQFGRIASSSQVRRSSESTRGPIRSVWPTDYVF